MSVFGRAVMGKVPLAEGAGQLLPPRPLLPEGASQPGHRCTGHLGLTSPCCQQHQPSAGSECAIKGLSTGEQEVAPQLVFQAFAALWPFQDSAAARRGRGRPR